MRAVVWLLIVSMSVVSLAACETEPDSAYGRKAAFVRIWPDSALVGDFSCTLQTDGYVYGPGSVPLQFVNHADADGAVKVTDRSGKEMGSADLRAEETVDVRLKLGPGRYQVRCFVAGRRVGHERKHGELERVPPAEFVVGRRGYWESPGA